MTLAIYTCTLIVHIMFFFDFLCMFVNVKCNVSWFQKGKTNGDFTEATDSE